MPDRDDADERGDSGPAHPRRPRPPRPAGSPPDPRGAAPDGRPRRGAGDDRPPPRDDRRDAPRRAPAGDGEPPAYTVYGKGGRRRPRSGAPRADAGRDQPGDSERPAYTVYEARRRFGRRHDQDDQLAPEPDGPRRPRRRRGRQRSLPVRILRGVLVAAIGWVLLSVVLFLVSAQIHQQGGKVDEVLGGGGAPFTPTNVLVLGTDARPKGSKEPGSEGGVSRTDTIMLMRTGGFANAKLSVPRDTIVTIPGHGLSKINAAYAFDGTRGTVRAVESLTGIDVNHVAEMDFQNFPGLIDAMGGIGFTPKSCLTAVVSGGSGHDQRSGVTSGGGRYFGGTSFRLRKGESYHLTGRQALALARVRKNTCDAGQDDINRAQRQQQILSAMKRRVLSPAGFLRLPMIAWKAPQAVKTDMSGFSLLGVAIGQFLPGGGSSAVLKPSGVQTLPDGGQGLIVNQSDVDRARRKFDK